MTMRPLEQKIAVITGAGSGIGRASALRFAEAGARVAVIDVARDNAAAVATQINAGGGTAIAMYVDVTVSEEIREAFVSIVQQFGAIDILFNNAGGAFPNAIESQSIEDYRKIIALNLDAVFYGVHAALPIMLQQRRGVILSTTSGAGLNAVPGLAIYGAAKAGVISLMKSIAVEFGQRGIRANTISPGPMDTPGLRTWLDTFDDGPNRYAQQIPSGRLGTADDIAKAAVFLASDHASFINGAVLPVDGAIHARLGSPSIS
jgi:NAD(P)-dependent dehydrogenase (short-subunit alcohol dehydrogenase family)